MGKNQELKQVAALKTIMMFLVVLYHSLLACSRNGWGGVNDFRDVPSEISYLAAWLNMFHIHFFTFASGYLFYMLRYEKGRYRTPKTDLSNRFRRLMIPFFCVSAIWAIPAQLLAYGFSWSIIIKGFVLQISPAQLWFLPMLFHIYVLFYYCSDWVKDMPLWLVCVVYAGIYVIKTLVGEYVPLGIFQISSAIEYSLYYYLGFHARRSKLWNPSNKQAICICFVALVIAFGYINLAVNHQAGYLVDIIRPGVCAIQIFAVFALGKVLKIDRLVCNRWFSYFADSSMGIYLFHQQFLYAIMRLLPKMPTMPQIFIYFGIALLLSACLTSMIKKTKFREIVA